MVPPTQHARGWINVTSYNTKPIDAAAAPAILEAHVIEEFTGDLEGTGTVRYNMMQTADGCAHFTGMERFTGKLGDRKGSFILQNTGSLKNGELNSEWLVIEGSGTGELAGLRGQGGTRTQDGYFLDYWFE